MSTACLVFHYQKFLSVVKCRQLAWFGYVTHHYTPPKIVLQGTLRVDGREGGRRNPGIVPLGSRQMLACTLVCDENRVLWSTLIILLMLPSYHQLTHDLDYAI